MAIGATPGETTRLVLRDYAVMVAAGLAVGALLAAGTMGLVRAYLFGITPRDSGTYLAVALLLAVVAGTAGWLPLRRIPKVNLQRQLTGD